VEEVEVEKEDGDEERVVIPMAGQEHVRVSTLAGCESGGDEDGGEAAAAAVDGAVAEARFVYPNALALLRTEDSEGGFPGAGGGGAGGGGAGGGGVGGMGGLLVSDHNSIRRFNARLDQVSTVAGDGAPGLRDGASGATRFRDPRGLALLPDGRVLVADFCNHRICALSADLREVSTVAGGGGAERGHADGAAATGATLNYPRALALLPDGRVLVAQSHGIRVLSADLQQLRTVAGGGAQGRRDGAAAQAAFFGPSSLALMPDGRVLVVDSWNHSIRVLSADLQQVSTVAGDGAKGYRDGAAAQARFHFPRCAALLPCGRVVVADQANHCVRLLSADLQQVSTVAGDGVAGFRDGAVAQASFSCPRACLALPDGRILVAGGDDHRIRCITGFGGTQPGSKPARRAGAALRCAAAARGGGGGASAAAGGGAGTGTGTAGAADATGATGSAGATAQQLGKRVWAQLT
jgi:hypothetical protein